MRVSTLVGSLLAIGALAACSSDTSTAPAATPSVTDADAAVVAGDATAQDVELMHGPSVGAYRMGLFASALHFGCNREYPPGLTVDVTCTYKDADGNVQTDYDALTTASINMVATLQGDFNRGHFSGTLDRMVDLTVSGLEGTETTRTWNGSGHSNKTRVYTTSDGETRSYDVESTSTITDVVVPVPRTDTSWPLSGTIHRVITLTKADGSTVTRDVTITFNGTQSVTIEVNGESFDFDLSARGRPHFRRP